MAENFTGTPTHPLMPDEKIAEASDAAQPRLLSAALWALAIAIAAFLRFYLIGLKPLHHDEGVNAFFLLRLYREGDYAYDPTNYHGPTLYYFALVALYLFKQTELALRFWPALMGVAAAGMIWPLRRWLGAVGTPVAAFFIALSPGLVYFSRDFIHEMSFGFFSLGIVVSAWLYVATRRFLYLALLAASTGLLFATKETALITAVVLALAALCAALWESGRRLTVDSLRQEGRFRLPLSPVWREIWREWREAWPLLDALIAALVVFVFVNVLFYSSFFTYWTGVVDAVKSVVMWTERGVTEGQHDHAWHYYLGILFKLELPLLIGASLGGIIALWRGTRFGLFLFAWAMGITLGYSLIPYKTPWLSVSMLLPLALLSGYAMQEIFTLLKPLSLRFLTGAGLLPALILCGQMAWRVNFDKPDDNTNSSGYLLRLGTWLKLTAYTSEQYGGYVYAQTDRDALRLVQAIDEAAERRLTGKNTGIFIAAPGTDYWPLPWYLRDYPGVAYVGSVPSAVAQPLIIASVSQQAEVEQILGPTFQSEAFRLRPGVELVLYVRE